MLRETVAEDQPLQAVVTTNLTLGVRRPYSPTIYLGSGGKSVLISGPSVFPCHNSLGLLYFKMILAVWRKIDLEN